MIKERKINIAPMRVMFGKIIPGEDIERLLIDNFSIPNTKHALEVFYKEYGGLAYDSEALFHFVTYFKTFLFKVAPIDNKDFINSIDIKSSTIDNSGLILEIRYNIE
jgi:hypothetical protein